jgi:uncharacterized protein (DUF433 family)
MSARSPDQFAGWTSAGAKRWSACRSWLPDRPDGDHGEPRHKPRIPVATVVGMLAEGMSNLEILTAYPDLQTEDIREAMRYAAEAVRERELPLAASA